MKILYRTLAVLALLVGSAAASSQTKIVFGSPQPGKGGEARAIAAFVQRVEKASNGDVKFEPNYDGQLVNFRSSLAGVKDGLVDSITLYPAFYLSELKVTNTFVDMGAFATESWAHVAAVAETLLLNCPQCDAEYARYKLKPLALGGSGPYLLMCRNPVTSAADLKGKSIRAMSAHQGLVKAIGANPVGTVPAEVFEAMQRGQVECAAGGLDFMQQFGLADVAKFVIDTPIGHDISRIPLAMNSDVWKKLKPEQKQAILRNLAFLTAEATANNIADTAASRQFAQGKGVKFGSAGAEFDKPVATYRKGELARIAKDASARGVEGSDALIATFQNKLAKWQKIVSDAGGDRTKYEEALWREVYSKLN